MKEVLTRHRSREEISQLRGTYVSRGRSRVLSASTAIYDKDTDNLVLKMVKNAVSFKNMQTLINATMPCVSGRLNNVRGAAAGPLTTADIGPSEEKFNTFVKKGLNGFRSNKGVRSCVVGVTRKEKLSKWTVAHKHVIADIHECILSVDATFRQQMPDMYKHMEDKKRLLKWTFPGSVFSSITVNKTFRTGLHSDNNKRDTYSVMLVAGDDFQGGHLVFPEYNISCDLRPGDMIIFDSRLYHGNSAIKTTSADRYSFVFYQK